MCLVDDGSGTIACCLWSNSIPFHYVPMEIGTAVRVLGKITTVIEERQIVIYDICKQQKMSVWMITNLHCTSPIR